MVETVTLKKNKRDDGDNKEEEESQKPDLQSAKRKKQLDTCELLPVSLYVQQYCKAVVKNNVYVISTARCQISDESKDEEVQETETKEKKTNKAEKTTSLASLNSNYRRSSSSGSESNERVRYYIEKPRMV